MKVKRIDNYDLSGGIIPEFWSIYIKTTKPDRLYRFEIKMGTWNINDEEYSDFDTLAREKRLPHVVRKAVREVKAKLAKEKL